MRNMCLKHVAICLILSAATFGETARQYYNEIYKAGGLDRMADEYACFDDHEKLETFFIFGESKTIREFMVANGTFSKMSKNFQKQMKEDFLIMRGYDEGVTVGGEDFYSRDGSSWITEKFRLSNRSKTLGKMRFAITWETLRYKRSVEILNADGSFQNEYARYGKCERVPNEIQQHGNP